MKKNLKKAISAVIAFAVAGSMIPASFAAKLTLTDVADTASYATAVNTLVALGVINGYEDNTFLPDNLITRAEVTKVVVAALNEADAAEGMKGDTGFTDVEAKHEWATGFINAGVAKGFINGMENNTFAPDANVTYAQIVTMLVRALGYEEYAQYMGGYPNGYLSIANAEGVTKDVKANANEAVTRAQVAQLVYNALKTPIVENTGMEFNAQSGGFVPNISKMDGTKDTYYKTMLTQYFDAYYVEGYVTETAKAGNLKSDEVKFAIAKSEKYEEDEFTTDKDNSIFKDMEEAKLNGELTVKVGDTDAADYEGSYAQAIIMQDEYMDNVMISFQSSGKNKVVEFDASWIDTDEFNEDSNGDYIFPADQTYLEYNASETATKSTKYSLQKDSSKNLDVKLYVNGRLMETNSSDKTIDKLISKFVVNNNVGKVQLVDTYKTDGYYDTIYVNHYATAKVSMVNTTSGKVSLTGTKGVKKGTSITLDDEDEDLVYNIYYNGEKVALTDLKKDDVLSIAYDANKDDLANSTFYDVYVSREIKTEKVTGKNDNDEFIKCGATEYKFVGDYAAFAKNIELGDQYTFYLDAFGRIFDNEMDSSSKNYAVVDKYTFSTSDDDYRLYLYTADGVSKTYPTDTNDLKITIDGKAVTGTKAEKKAAIEKAVYVDGSSAKGKNDIQKRVITYEVKASTGYVREIEFVNPVGDGSKAPFKARTGAIGSVKMSDATKIVDAIEYVEAGDNAKIVDLGVATLASFADDEDYVAYAYGDKIDGIYPFVVVTEGAAAYNETTRFAVVSNLPGEAKDENEDTIYEIPALYLGTQNDAEQILKANDECAEALNLKVGDIIFFNNGSDGYIKEYQVISNWTDIADYDKVVAQGIVNDNAGKNVNLAAVSALNADFVTAWDDEDIEHIRVVFGPIVDANEKNLSIGKISADITDYGHGVKEDDGVFDIGLTTDTNAYLYDYSMSTKNRLSTISAGSIPYVELKKKADADIIDWTDEDNKAIVNFAFAVVFEGDATDVLVLQAK